MVYLLISIVASVVISVLLKRGEGTGHDRLVVTASNYISATVLAGGIWLLRGAVWPSWPTVLLGIAGGFFYAISLVLWMQAIERAGIAMSTAALRMSVALPVAMSMLFFGEQPSLNQGLGIVFTLLAIVLITLSGRATGEGVTESAVVLLLLVFLTGGGAYATLKLFTELRPPPEKEALLTLIFLSALVMSWVTVACGKHRFRRADIANGLAIGTCNVTSNGMMLLALQTVPGVLAFPFVNTSVLLSTAFLGTVVWRERPGGFGYLSIGASIVAIVLLTT
jgi:drug/metabolite transporter (DMT)-like permease